MSESKEEVPQEQQQQKGKQFTGRLDLNKRVATKGLFFLPKDWMKLLQQRP